MKKPQIQTAIEILGTKPIIQELRASMGSDKLIVIDELDADRLVELLLEYQSIGNLAVADSLLIDLLIEKLGV